MDIPFSRRPITRTIQKTQQLYSKEPFGSVYKAEETNQQIGIFRSPELKINAKVIDCRLDEVERNSKNMFSGRAGETFRVARPAPVNGRHTHTPYDYGTDRLIKTEKTDEFKTTFLSTPISDLEKEEKRALRQSKYNEKTVNFARTMRTVDELENKAREEDQRSINGIRNQRAEYEESLAERRKHERVSRFE